MHTSTINNLQLFHYNYITGSVGLEISPTDYLLYLNRRHQIALEVYENLYKKNHKEHFKTYISLLNGPICEFKTKNTKKPLFYHYNLNRFENHVTENILELIEQGKSISFKKLNTTCYQDKTLITKVYEKISTFVKWISGIFSSVKNKVNYYYQILVINIKKIFNDIKLKFNYDIKPLAEKEDYLGAETIIINDKRKTILIDPSKITQESDFDRQIQIWFKHLNLPKKELTLKYFKEQGMKQNITLIAIHLKCLKDKKYELLIKKIRKSARNHVTLIKIINQYRQPEKTCLSLAELNHLQKKFGDDLTVYYYYNEKLPSQFNHVDITQNTFLPGLNYKETSIADFLQQFKNKVDTDFYFNFKPVVNEILINNIQPYCVKTLLPNKPVYYDYISPNHYLNHCSNDPNDINFSNKPRMLPYELFLELSEMIVFYNSDKNFFENVISKIQKIYKNIKKMFVKIYEKVKSFVLRMYYVKLSNLLWTKKIFECEDEDLKKLYVRMNKPDNFDYLNGEVLWDNCEAFKVNYSWYLRLKGHNYFKNLKLEEIWKYPNLTYKLCQQILKPNQQCLQGNNLSNFLASHDDTIVYYYYDEDGPVVFNHFTMMEESYLFPLRKTTAKLFKEKFNGLYDKFYWQQYVTLKGTETTFQKIYLNVYNFFLNIYSKIKIAWESTKLFFKKIYDKVKDKLDKIYKTSSTNNSPHGSGSPTPVKIPETNEKLFTIILKAASYDIQGNTHRSETQQTDGAIHTRRLIMHYLKDHFKNYTELIEFKSSKITKEELNRVVTIEFHGMLNKLSQLSINDFNIYLEKYHLTNNHKINILILASIINIKQMKYQFIKDINDGRVDLDKILNQIGNPRHSCVNTLQGTMDNTIISASAVFQADTLIDCSLNHVGNDQHILNIIFTGTFKEFKSKFPNWEKLFYNNITSTDQTLEENKNTLIKYLDQIIDPKQNLTEIQQQRKKNIIDRINGLTEPIPIKRNNILIGYKPGDDISTHCYVKLQGRMFYMMIKATLREQVLPPYADKKLFLEYMNKEKYINHIQFQVLENYMLHVDGVDFLTDHFEPTSEAIIYQNQNIEQCKQYFVKKKDVCSFFEKIEKVHNEKTNDKEINVDEIECMINELYEFETENIYQKIGINSVKHGYCFAKLMYNPMDYDSLVMDPDTNLLTCKKLSDEMLEKFAIEDEMPEVMSIEMFLKYLSSSNTKHVEIYLGENGELHLSKISKAMFIPDEEGGQYRIDFELDGSIKSSRCNSNEHFQFISNRDKEETKQIKHKIDNNEYNTGEFVIMTKEAFAYFLRNNIAKINGTLLKKQNPTGIKIGVMTKIFEKYESIFHNTVTNNYQNNPMFKGILDKSDADKAEEIEKSIKCNKIYINANMTDKALENLVTDFPNYNIYPKNDDYLNKHNFYSASRVLAEETIYNMLPKQFLVFDIGGAYHRHISRQRFNVHSCFLTTNEDQESRAIDQQLAVNTRILQQVGKLRTEEKKRQMSTIQELSIYHDIFKNPVRNKSFCHNDAELCNIAPIKGVGLGMSVDSLWDINPFKLARIHRKKKIVKSVHAISIPIDSLYTDKGELMHEEGFFEIKNNKIFMIFNQGSTVYHNDFDTLLLYLKHKIIITNEMSIYIKSEGYIGAHLILKVYSLSTDIVLKKLFYNAIWLTKNLKMKIFRVPLINPKLPSKLIRKKFEKLTDKNIELIPEGESEFTKIFSETNNVQYENQIQFFIVEEVLVHLDLLNLLETRLMGFKTEGVMNVWTSLLEYGRGLKFQTNIVKTHMLLRFVTDVSLLYKHCLIAFQNYIDIQNMMLPLIHIMGQGREENFFEKFKKSINNIFYKILSNFDPMNLDIVKDLMEEGNLNERVDMLNPELVRQFSMMNIEAKMGCNALINNTPALIDPEFTSLSENTTITYKNIMSNEFEYNEGGTSVLKNLLIPEKTKEIECDHACEHNCQTLGHFGYITRYDTKDICICCKKTGYLINNLCCVCDREGLCVNTSNCKAVHQHVSEHCCNSRKCNCILKYVCNCCKKNSVSDPCPLCLNSCTPNITIEQIIPQENKKTKPKDQNNYSSKAGKSGDDKPNDNMQSVFDEKKNITVFDKLTDQLIHNKPLDVSTLHSAIPPASDTFTYNELINTFGLPKKQDDKPIDIEYEYTQNYFENLKNTDLDNAQEKDFFAALNAFSNEEQKIVGETSDSKIDNKPTFTSTNPFNLLNIEQQTIGTIIIKLNSLKDTDVTPILTKNHSVLLEGKPKGPSTFKIINGINEKPLNATTYKIKDLYKSFIDDGGASSQYDVNLNIKFVNIEHAGTYKENSPFTVEFPFKPVLIGENLTKYRRAMINLQAKMYQYHVWDVIKFKLPNLKCKKNNKLFISWHLNHNYLLSCLQNLIKLLKSKKQMQTEKIQTFAQELRNVTLENVSALTLKELSETEKTKGVSGDLMKAVIDKHRIRIDKKVVTEVLIKQSDNLNFELAGSVNLLTINSYTNVLGDGKCGWYCLQAIFGFNDDDYLEFCMFTNKTEWFSNIDMLNYASYKNKNLCVCTTSTTMYVKNDSSLLFGFILDTNIFDNQDHWVIGHCVIDMLNDNMTYEGTLLGNGFFFMNLHMILSSVNMEITPNDMLSYKLTDNIKKELKTKLLTEIEYQEDTMEDLLNYRKNYYPNLTLDIGEQMLHGTTETFNQSDPVKTYSKQFGIITVLYGPCSFGKTLKFFEEFCSTTRKNIIIVIPLITAIKSTVKAYKKLNLSIGARYEGKFHFENIDESKYANVFDCAKQCRLLIYTVDSLVNSLRHIDYNNTIILLDEIHSSSVNYLEILEHVLKHGNIGMCYVASATLHKNLTIKSSRYPIKIYEHDMIFINDIPKYVEGVTAVIFATQYEAVKARDKLVDVLKGKKISIVSSNTLKDRMYWDHLNKQTMLETDIYFATDCISTGFNDDRLCTVIDLGKRLYIDYQVPTKNFNPWKDMVNELTFRDHTFSEKIQTQRRVGRFQAGTYHGVCKIGRINMNTAEKVDSFLKLGTLLPSFLEAYLTSEPVKLLEFEKYPIPEKKKETLDNMSTEMRQREIQFVKNKFISYKENINKLEQCREYLPGKSLNPEGVAIFSSEETMTLEGVTYELIEKHAVRYNRTHKAPQTINVTNSEIQEIKNKWGALNVLTTNKISTFTDSCAKCFKLYYRIITHSKLCNECVSNDKVFNLSQPVVPELISALTYTLNLINPIYDVFNVNGYYQINLYPQIYNTNIEGNVKQSTINIYLYLQQQLILLYKDMLLQNKYEGEISYVKNFTLYNLNRLDIKLEDLYYNNDIRQGDTICLIYNDGTKHLFTVTSLTEIEKITNIHTVVIAKEKTYFIKLLMLKLLSNSGNLDKNIKKIKEAVKINGVAGSGKTDKFIIKQPSTMIIVNQPHIKEKLKKTTNCQVLTMTGLLTSKKITFVDKLYIDESNTMTSFVLKISLPACNDLFLIGDSYQLPPIMNEQLFCTEDEVGLLHNVNHDKDFKKSYRVGKNHCKLLNNMGFDIQSDKTNDIVMIHIFEDDAMTVDNFIKHSGEKCNYYLCVSNKDVYKYKKQNQLINITTVAKYEGSEELHIGLIINHVDKYTEHENMMYTALTRAKSKTSIYVNKDCLKSAKLRKMLNIGESNGQTNLLINTLFNKYLMDQKTITLAIRNGNIYVSTIIKKTVNTVNVIYHKLKDFLINLYKTIINKMVNSDLEENTTNNLLVNNLETIGGCLSLITEHANNDVSIEQTCKDLNKLCDTIDCVVSIKIKKIIKNEKINGVLKITKIFESIGNFFTKYVIDKTKPIFYYIYYKYLKLKFFYNARNLIQQILMSENKEVKLNYNEVHATIKLFRKFISFENGKDKIFYYRLCAPLMALNPLKLSVPELSTFKTIVNELTDAEFMLIFNTKAKKIKVKNDNTIILTAKDNTITGTKVRPFDVQDFDALSLTVSKILVSRNKIQISSVIDNITMWSKNIYLYASFIFNYSMNTINDQELNEYISIACQQEDALKKQLMYGGVKTKHNTSSSIDKIGLELLINPKNTEGNLIISNILSGAKWSDKALPSINLMTCSDEELFIYIKELSIIMNVTSEYGDHKVMFSPVYDTLYGYVPTCINKDLQNNFKEKDTFMKTIRKTLQWCVTTYNLPVDVKPWTLVTHLYKGRVEPIRDSDERGILLLNKHDVYVNVIEKTEIFLKKLNELKNKFILKTNKGELINGLTFNIHSISEEVIFNWVGENSHAEINIHKLTELHMEFEKELSELITENGLMNLNLNIFEKTKGTIMKILLHIKYFFMWVFNFIKEGFISIYELLMGTSEMLESETDYKQSFIELSRQHTMLIERYETLMLETLNISTKHGTQISQLIDIKKHEVEESFEKLKDNKRYEGLYKTKRKYATICTPTIHSTIADLEECVRIHLKEIQATNPQYKLSYTEDHGKFNGSLIIKAFKIPIPFKFSFEILTPYLTKITREGYETYTVVEKLDQTSVYTNDYSYVVEHLVKMLSQINEGLIVNNGGYEIFEPTFNFKDIIKHTINAFIDYIKELAYKTYLWYTKTFNPQYYYSTQLTATKNLFHFFEQGVNNKETLYRNISHRMVSLENLQNFDIKGKFYLIEYSSGKSDSTYHCVFISNTILDFKKKDLIERILGMILGTFQLNLVTSFLATTAAMEENLTPSQDIKEKLNEISKGIGHNTTNKNKVKLVVHDINAMSDEVFSDLHQTVIDLEVPFYKEYSLLGMENKTLKDPTLNLFDEIYKKLHTDNRVVIEEYIENEKLKWSTVLGTSGKKIFQLDNYNDDIILNRDGILTYFITLPTCVKVFSNEDKTILQGVMEFLENENQNNNLIVSNGLEKIGMFSIIKSVVLNYYYYYTELLCYNWNYYVSKIFSKHTFRGHVKCDNVAAMMTTMNNIINKFKAQISSLGLVPTKILYKTYQGICVKVNIFDNLTIKYNSKTYEFDINYHIKSDMVGLIEFKNYLHNITKSLNEKEKSEAKQQPTDMKNLDPKQEIKNNNDDMAFMFSEQDSQKDLSFVSQIYGEPLPSDHKDKVDELFDTELVYNLLQYKFKNKHYLMKSTGSLYLLKGPSGSGKTSLMNMMFHTPQNISSNLNIGVLNKNDIMYMKQLSVIEQMSYQDARDLVLSSEEFNNDTFETLSLILNLKDIKGDNISGGEMTRIMLALIYSKYNLKLIFLDEIDVTIGRKYNESLFKFINNCKDKITVAITHKIYPGLHENIITKLIQPELKEMIYLIIEEPHLCPMYENNYTIEQLIDHIHEMPCAPSEHALFKVIYKKFSKNLVEWDEKEQTIVKRLKSKKIKGELMKTMVKILYNLNPIEKITAYKDRFQQSEDIITSCIKNFKVGTKSSDPNKEVVRQIIFAVKMGVMKGKYTIKDHLDVKYNILSALPKLSATANITNNDDLLSYVSTFIDYDELINELNDHELTSTILDDLEKIFPTIKCQIERKILKSQPKNVFCDNYGINLQKIVQNFEQSVGLTKDFRTLFRCLNSDHGDPLINTLIITDSLPQVIKADSGTGKSLTLKVLSNLANYVYISQKQNLPHMTVLDFMCLCIAIKYLNTDLLINNIMVAPKIIKNFFPRMLRDLSGGERVLLYIYIFSSLQITHVIFDETLQGLHDEYKQKMLKFIREEHPNWIIVDHLSGQETKFRLKGFNYDAGGILDRVLLVELNNIEIPLISYEPNNILNCHTNLHQCDFNLSNIILGTTVNSSLKTKKGHKSYVCGLEKNNLIPVLYEGTLSEYIKHLLKSHQCNPITITSKVDEQEKPLVMDIILRNMEEVNLDQLNLQYLTNLRNIETLKEEMKKQGINDTIKNNPKIMEMLVKIKCNLQVIKKSTIKSNLRANIYILSDLKSTNLQDSYVTEIIQLKKKLTLVWFENKLYMLINKNIDEKNYESLTDKTNEYYNDYKIGIHRSLSTIVDSFELEVSKGSVSYKDLLGRWTTLNSMIPEKSFEKQGLDVDKTNKILNTLDLFLPHNTNTIREINDLDLEHESAKNIPGIFNLENISKLTKEDEYMNNNHIKINIIDTNNIFITKKNEMFEKIKNAFGTIGTGIDYDYKTIGEININGYKFGEQKNFGHIHINHPYNDSEYTIYIGNTIQFQNYLNSIKYKINLPQKLVENINDTNYSQLGNMEYIDINIDGFMNLFIKKIAKFTSKSNELLISLLRSVNERNYHDEHVATDEQFYLSSDQVDDICYELEVPKYRIYQGPYIEEKRKLGYLTAPPTLTRPAPLRSLNVICKAVNQKINAVQKLRKYKIPHDKQLEVYSSAYFKPYALTIMKHYQNNEINIDGELIKNWLCGRNIEKILQEYDEMSYLKHTYYNINKVRMIEKSESITKGDEYANLNEMINRVVLWNPYAYSMLFAPIYSTAKYRFKKLLKHNVIYAEDMNINELNERLHTIDLNNKGVFLESDLSKQDRQTDLHSLNFEYNMYELLGVNPIINRFYKKQHEQTKLKTKEYTGTTSPKRHTGQTTVGFGNAINSTRSYANFFNQHKFSFLMFLGDDMLSRIEQNFDEKALEKEIQIFHNMKSTYSLKQTCGIFCQMIVAEIDKNLIIVPNLIRMEDRLRSLHVIGDNVKDALKTRFVSYCWMLGPSDETNMICRMYGVPMPKKTYFSKDILLTVNGIYHGTTQAGMLNTYYNLIYTMKMMEIHELTFSIVGKKQVNTKSGSTI